MPLYEGKTVGEAMRKALGIEAKKTGKPFGASKIGGRHGKPSGVRKANPPTNTGHTGGFRTETEQREVDESPARLAQLRSDAIRNAEQDPGLRNASLEINEPEYGYMEVFFTDNGEILKLSGLKAGRPRRTIVDGQTRLLFDYSYRKFAHRPFWILVFAHTHPKDRRGVHQREFNHLAGLSNADQSNLNSLAPVVIRYPLGRYKNWGSATTSYRKANH